MRYSARVTTFFDRVNRRYKTGRDRGLAQTAALIRREAREKMRRRVGPSRPFTPPHVHSRSGLREINFDVSRGEAIIGPRKFPRSRFFNRPVPNIHEKGGVVSGISFKRRFTARYAERSFMWSAVKRLTRRGKIQSRFVVSLRSSI